MPDPSSSHDDAFNALFAKLPDPRAREVSPDAATGPAPATPPTQPLTPPADSSAGTGAPLSRREAREAAAREAMAASPPAAPLAETASLPASPPSDAPPAPLDAPAESTPAVPESVGEGSALQGHAAVPSATSGSPTLDDLFAAHSDGSGGRPPKRERRRIGGWIALGVILLILGGVTVAAVWAWTTYEDQIREVLGWEEPKDYEEGLAHGEAAVTVASGDTGQSISQTLYDAGVTRTPEAFYDMLIDTQQNPTFYPGVYQLQKQMTSAAALEALLDPANRMESTALLREGLTVDQTLPILAESLEIPVEDFYDAVADPSVYGVGADSLEGWLFPAMYTFDPGTSAQDVIATMVDRTRQSLDAAQVPEEDQQEILTIASIIQREARFQDDFYKVSRVIQNRLDPNNQETFGLLQMDSTAQYGFGEIHDGTVSTSAEALADDNPWNTYVNTGLPVGPISNPGDLAIDAAMHPVDGPWLYFVTVNLDTGETVFTDNLADHNRAVAQWQSWCADHPDSGC